MTWKRRIHMKIFLLAVTSHPITARFAIYILRTEIFWSIQSNKRVPGKPLYTASEVSVARLSTIEKQTCSSAPGSIPSNTWRIWLSVGSFVISNTVWVLSLPEFSWSERWNAKKDGCCIKNMEKADMQISPKVYWVFRPVHGSGNHQNTSHKLGILASRNFILQRIIFPSYL